MLLRTLLITLVALAYPAAAQAATTFCVNTPCEGVSKPSLYEAMLAAQESSGKDTIMLGKGPHVGSISIKPTNPVDIVGPMEGAKIVSTKEAGIWLEDSTSSLKNLVVQTNSINGAIGVDITAAGATIDHVGVIDTPGTKQQVGIRVLRGANLRHVWTNMTTTGSWGISVAAGEPKAMVDIVDAHVIAPNGVKVWQWTYPVRLRDVRAEAKSTALFVGASSDFSASNLSASVESGRAAQFESSGATLSHATLVAREKTSLALYSMGTSLEISDSALLGGMWDAMTNTPLELAHSAFRPQNVSGPLLQPGKSNVDLSKSALNVGQDFVPTAGSALIDTGTPGGPAGFDLEHRARPADGDHDGVARRDIGAYEAPAGTNAAPAPVVLIDPDAKPPVVTPPVIPVVPVVTPAPVVTPIPVIPTPARPATVSFGSLKGRVLRGRAAGSLTRVAVTVRKAKRCAAKSGTLTRRCSSLRATGTRSWSLKFKRRLPRGTYTITLRALDAKGKTVATTTRKVRVA